MPGARLTLKSSFSPLEVGGKWGSKPARTPKSGRGCTCETGFCDSRSPGFLTLLGGGRREHSCCWGLFFTRIDFRWGSHLTPLLGTKRAQCRVTATCTQHRFFWFSSKWFLSAGVGMRYRCPTPAKKSEKHGWGILGSFLNGRLRRLSPASQPFLFFIKTVTSFCRGNSNTSATQGWWKDPDSFFIFLRFIVLDMQERMIDKEGTESGS